MCINCASFPTYRLLYPVSSLTLALTMYTVEWANSVHCLCTVHLRMHLERKMYMHSAAVRELRSYYARELCTVEGANSGQCTCAVPFTLNMNCASVRELTEYNARALLSCACSDSVHYTCIVQRWMH